MSPYRFSPFRVVTVIAGALLFLSLPHATLSQTGGRADSRPIQVGESAPIADLLASAREMVSARNLPVAEMLYKSVLIREPQNVDAMVELAEVYEAMGKLDHARGLLTRASIASPHNREIIDRAARITSKMSRVLGVEIDSLIAIGAYDLALPKLSVLLTSEPENAELLYKKATCHLNLGHPDVAIAEIDRALKLRQNDRYYRLRADAQKMGRSDEIRLLEAHARQLVRSGTALDNPAAREALSRVVAADPNNTWARRQLTILASARDRIDERQRVMSRWPAMAWADMKKLARAAAPVVATIASGMRQHIQWLVLILVVLVLLNSPVSHAIARGVAPRHMLAGRLEQFSLQEILTLVNTHGCTGRLRVKAKDVKGDIFFDTGEIYHCRVGRDSGRKALQELLRDAVSGHFFFVRAKLSSQRTIDTPLSLILLGLPARTRVVSDGDPMRMQKSRIKELLDSNK